MHHQVLRPFSVKGFFVSASRNSSQMIERLSDYSSRKSHPQSNCAMCSPCFHLTHPARPTDAFHFPPAGEDQVSSWLPQLMSLQGPQTVLSIFCHPTISILYNALDSYRSPLWRGQVQSSFSLLLVFLIFLSFLPRNLSPVQKY